MAWRNRLELVLHPVRLRLILELVKGERTVDDLQAAIPEVSRPTLYRHLRRLEEGGLVRVVGQRAVRGTVEKSYTLATEQLILDQATMAHLSREEHLEFFVTFLSSLLGDYARYLAAHPAPDLQADGVGFHQHVFFLNEAEFQAFVRALNHALLPFAQNQAAPGRIPRLFATILMPLEITSNSEMTLGGEKNPHEDHHREPDQNL
ncbi:helix-turn-helix domain-containing protein [Thermanaerothrix sp. 4228-RoL]|uniref:Helix-turn-helix domain-containing protein n=1 Tax=Thermanaerothrix solaris TaxID=3058434 RepID=A0ABU3NP73_9CHLR|nr:helix-turn-helix domain-containing protein [Thermanaerothrix sp. 4228-RoL]MDT8898648.1 helix-turn-helix domain-containing protein [Thermanaerothrix sp. 4228-RoL]